jgi:putative transposase
MLKVPVAKVVGAIEAPEGLLPAPVQEALGELVGAAREGLLALSVGAGLGVVHELMELEVAEVVGPKGKHNADRTAKRHGHENGSMTARWSAGRGALAADAQRRRPARAAGPQVRILRRSRPVDARGDGSHADRRIDAQVRRARRARRRAGRAIGLGGVEVVGVGEVRRAPATAVEELMSRQLEDVRLVVVMLDGLEIAERCHVVALGITTDGVKLPLGLWEAAPRTRRWPARCSPTWSTTGSIPNRRSGS